MGRRAGAFGWRLFGSTACVLAVLTLVGCNDGGSTPSSSLTQSPDISGAPATQARIGQAYSFTPTVAEAHGRLGFSIQNKPAWASFSIATGQLAGTPTSADAGTYAGIIITASNGVSSASLPPFTLTVSQGGTVTLNWQAPTTNTDGSPLTNLAGYTIAYGANPNALTQSVTVDNPTTTVYSVQNLSSGTWYFAVSADTSDGTQSALSSVVSTTVQ
jgi:hypothetical protein